jgi:WavE lipopolysaccharide synthesis
MTDAIPCTIYVSPRFKFLTRLFATIPHLTVTDKYTADVTFSFTESFRQSGTQGTCYVHTRTTSDLQEILSDELQNRFSIENTVEYDNEIIYYMRPTTKSHLHPKVTFVIQGPFHLQNARCAYPILFLFGKLIIATWDRLDFNTVQEYVQNHNIYNKQNVYYQVVSTLSGLSNVSTEYVVKVRSDELYTNWNTFIQTMFKHSQKIICNNIFMRSPESQVYHPSDHVIGGLTQKVITMFSNAKDFLEKNLIQNTAIPKCSWFPEQVLCVSFLSSMYTWDELQDTSNAAQYMKEHWQSVHIYQMGYFQVCFTMLKTCKQTNITSSKKVIASPKTMKYFHTIIDLDSIESL